MCTQFEHGTALAAYVVKQHLGDEQVTTDEVGEPNQGGENKDLHNTGMPVSMASLTPTNPWTIGMTPGTGRGHCFRQDYDHNMSRVADAAFRRTRTHPFWLAEGRVERVVDAVKAVSDDHDCVRADGDKRGGLRKELVAHHRHNSFARVPNKSKISDYRTNHFAHLWLLSSPLDVCLHCGVCRLPASSTSRRG